MTRPPASRSRTDRTPRLPARNRPRRRRVARERRLRRQPAVLDSRPSIAPRGGEGERGGGGGRLRAMSRRGARASARYRRRSGRRIRPRRRRPVLVDVFRSLFEHRRAAQALRRTIDRSRPRPRRGRLRAFVPEQTFIHPRRIRTHDAELRGESRDRVHERSRRSAEIESLRPAPRVMRRRLPSHLAFHRRQHDLGAKHRANLAAASTEVLRRAGAFRGDDSVVDRRRLERAENTVARHVAAGKDPFGVHRRARDARRRVGSRRGGRGVNAPGAPDARRRRAGTRTGDGHDRRA